MGRPRAGGRKRRRLLRASRAKKRREHYDSDCSYQPDSDEESDCDSINDKNDNNNNNNNNSSSSNDMTNRPFTVGTKCKSKEKGNPRFCEIISVAPNATRKNVWLIKFVDGSTEVRTSQQLLKLKPSDVYPTPSATASVDTTTESTEEPTATDSESDSDLEDDPDPEIDPDELEAEDVDVVLTDEGDPEHFFNKNLLWTRPGFSW